MPVRAPVSLLAPLRHWPGRTRFLRARWERAAEGASVFESSPDVVGKSALCFMKDVAFSSSSAVLRLTGPDRSAVFKSRLRYSSGFGFKAAGGRRACVPVRSGLCGRRGHPLQRLIPSDNVAFCPRYGGFPCLKKYSQSPSWLRMLRCGPSRLTIPVPPAVDWTLICSSCDLAVGIRLNRPGY